MQLPRSRRVASIALCASLFACSTTDPIAPDASSDLDGSSDEAPDGSNGDGRDGSGDGAQADGAPGDGAQADGDPSEPDGGSDRTPDDAGWQPPGFVHTDGTNIVDGAGNRLFFKGINLGN